MKTVLVVDDEWAIADTLKALLTDEGYHVVTARNGREGLACLPIARPDLVLLDLMMPGINGHEMLAQLRADPAYSTLPVILMSAGQSTLDAPGDGVAFLRKPFMLEQLLRLIAEQIGPAASDPPDGAPQPGGIGHGEGA